LKLGFKLFLVQVIIIISSTVTIAQERYYSKIVRDTVHINFDNLYHLSNPAVIPFTETVQLNRRLLNKNEYSISYEKAELKLSNKIPYSIFDTLIVTYQAINLNIKKEYEKRSIVYKFDEKSRDTLGTVKMESEPFSSEAIFGKGIEKSGTLVRGFTVGTNQDLTLQSGLRLQLSGKLADNIEVVAALTDENTPIQPEGNTAQLQELDKVFIQIRHPNAIATFGDFDLNEKYGEFGNVNRKLEGLLGEFNYDNQKGYIAVANSQGKYNTNQFNGTDGMQGPYNLTGANSENGIIIIAGTEKVYVDGILMKRGDRNDYTIDYANAQITFTPNKLITSASRITVDFQYSDRQFERTFFSTGMDANLFKNKLAIKVQYAREGDNKDAPIDIALSDSDKAVLAAAGNNRLKATKSGISIAAPDSLGINRGAYQKIDTTINGQDTSYYFYNPGGNGAIYNVSFSYIGSGQGDYNRIAIGNFKFVGFKKGEYLPIILLPMPELQQVANVAINYSFIPGVDVGVEFAGSNYDQNLFSSLDKSGDNGFAHNITLSIKPTQLNVGNFNLGKVGLSFQDRFLQSSYSPLDRINPIEFNRDFNISDTTQNQSQHLSQINFTYIPLNELNINSSYGLLKQGNVFTSKRFNNTITFTDTKTYNLQYNLDYVGSRDTYAKSNWYRQQADGFLTLGMFKPGFDFLAEDKRDIQNGADSILSSSLKYWQFDPFIQLLAIKGLTASTKYSLREDYAPIGGQLIKQAFTTGEFFQISFSGMREFSTSLNVIINNKNYTEDFKKLGSLNTQTILVQSQSRFNFYKPMSGDFYYEVSTQKTAKLQNVFVPVAQGTGNYIYLGDLNHNGIQDYNEFQPTLYDGNYNLVTIPTDQLYPVIDLKMNTRWHIMYGQIFKEGSFLNNFFKPLSSETSWRVEENSQEVDYKKIYLLDFADFQNPNKTIYGSNDIQQDMFLFENDPELSFRLRFAQRTNMNQYNGGIEQAYTRERSVRIKFKMIEEISNQTDIINQEDNMRAPANTNDRRQISGNSISSDFSYRPQKNIEVGFKFTSGRKQDNVPAIPTILNLNSQLIRITFSFVGSGRLKLQFERDELSVNTSQNYIPFQMTEGNVIGKNYYWSLDFDYKIAANLQSTVSYTGRLQGNPNPIHTARAEVRAYF